MYFLAPLVYLVVLSGALYKFDLIMPQEHYDPVVKRVKEYRQWQAQQKAQKKARKTVVQQFQAQPTYGTELAGMQAAEQYTILKMY